VFDGLLGDLLGWRVRRHRNEKFVVRKIILITALMFHVGGVAIRRASVGRLFLLKLVLLRTFPAFNHLLDVVLDILKFWLELQVPSKFFVATLNKASGAHEESAPETGFEAFDVRISIIIVQRIIQLAETIADSVLESVWKTTILVREGPR
jgi:hypothetical protein